MNIFAQVLAQIDQSPFVAELLASLLVGILLSIAIPPYIAWLRKPKELIFQFTKNDGNSNIYKLGKRTDGRFEFNFTLDLKHTSGDAFLHPIRWHLYLPKTINAVVGNIPGKPSLSYISEIVDQALHVHGEIEGPIYPQSTSTLLINFSGTFATKEQASKLDIPLFYFFTTEYGSFPVNYSRLNPNSDTGVLSTMQKIHLVYSE